MLAHPRWKLFPHPPHPLHLTSVSLMSAPVPAGFFAASLSSSLSLGKPAPHPEHFDENQPMRFTIRDSRRARNMWRLLGRRCRSALVYSPTSASAPLELGTEKTLEADPFATFTGSTVAPGPLVGETAIARCSELGP